MNILFCKFPAVCRAHNLHIFVSDDLITKILYYLLGLKTFAFFQMAFILPNQSVCLACIESNREIRKISGYQTSCLSRKLRFSRGFYQIFEPGEELSENARFYCQRHVLLVNYLSIERTPLLRNSCMQIFSNNIISFCLL